MQKPEHKRYNTDDKSVTLYFPDESHGRYQVRGAVCWPVLFDKFGRMDVMGYALIAGRNIETNKVTVFEQREFLVISDIVDEKGLLVIPAKEKNAKIYRGILSWFIDGWAKYRCHSYFYSQPFEVAKKYRTELRRSEAMKPKPQFIDVPWPGEDEALQTVWKALKMKSFRAEKDSILREQLGEVQKGSKDMYPAVHALACLLMGFERFRFKKAEAA